MQDIVGYENLYAITEDGKVWSYPKNGRGVGKHNGKWLSLYKSREGYFTVGLRKEGKLHLLLVHRLSALTFIPNFTNKPCVNHKNGIKTDNKINNLEWVTYSENCQHFLTELDSTQYRKKMNERLKNKPSPQAKAIECIDTGEMFANIRAAAKKYNLHNGNISNCCNGRSKSCGGMKWKFI